MSKFNNSRQNFLTNKVAVDVQAQRDKDFTDRATFNFSFFDESGKYGEKFNEWDHKKLVSLLEKIKTYSGKSLNFWRKDKKGGGLAFTYYEGFPKGSSFKLPKNIPNGAKWGSLRISTKMRILGFRLTGKNELDCNLRGQKNFDDNIFYVVWLDKDHKAIPRQNQGKQRR